MFGPDASRCDSNSRQRQGALTKSEGSPDRPCIHIAFERWIEGSAVLGSLAGIEIDAEVNITPQLAPAVRREVEEDWLRKRMMGGARRSATEPRRNRRACQLR